RMRCCAAPVPFPRPTAVVLPLASAPQTRPIPLLIFFFLPDVNAPAPPPFPYPTLFRSQLRWIGTGQRDIDTRHCRRRRLQTPADISLQILAEFGKGTDIDPGGGHRGRERWPIGRRREAARLDHRERGGAGTDRMEEQIG